MKIQIFSAILCSVFLQAIAGPSAIRSVGENRLLQFEESGPAQWFTPLEVNEIVSKHVNFMDITDHQLPQSAPPKVFEIPQIIRFKSTVEAAIAKLNVNRVGDFLTYFSGYFNRYYDGPGGAHSALWLHSQIQDAISTSNFNGSASVIVFEHSWAQSSILARIAGFNEGQQRVILSAHLDCITSGADAPSPGADDNGSGSAVLLEAFRALLESGFIPSKTVEFHWYAAEEVGLRGAQDIVSQYKYNEVDVVSVTNFDMAGFLLDSKIGFIMDFVDLELTTFLKLIVDTYSQYGWMERICGYACSDHAAWTREGYRASFAHEDGPNPVAHTLRDTIDNLDFNNIIEFAKLAVGYAIEMAEPST